MKMVKTKDLPVLVLLVLGIAFLLSFTFLHCEVAGGEATLTEIHVYEYKIVPQ